MLGRTAEDLYWMARYIERAENIARLLEVGHRLVLLPHDNADEEWRSTLRSAGCETSYLAKHHEYRSEAVVDFLLLDRDNPSSVLSCLAMARRNARSQRTALTRLMWEGLNSAWSEFAETAPRRTSPNELPALFDWIKERSALFRGALMNTHLRNDGFYFTQLGTFIERADNTSRILDVKYYMLLPENQLIGGGVDIAQWRTILRSVSAHSSFRWVYKGSISPWNVADFLILNGQMPRSLRFCYEDITAALQGLADFYGKPTAALESAEEIRGDLETSDINRIFQGGLHEFLLDFIARNNRLGEHISAAYHFYG
jgi:uncharacterized alpha-E superfamily protein